MVDTRSDDYSKAHRHFAPSCFNKTWELLDQFDGETVGKHADELVATAVASLWHWMQREDVTERNLSVGTWLLARVYATVERHDEAIYWGKRSLALAGEAGSAPFYVGYAHEALARAYQSLDAQRAQKHLATAHALAEEVENEENRQLLLEDLQQLQSQPA